MQRKLLLITLVIVIAMILVAPVEAGLNNRIEYREDSTAEPYAMPTYTPMAYTPTPYPMPLYCWSGGCYYPAP